jgi:anaerobic magnesium-protoporphyrin IX monomethyl ester cyclase
MMPNPRGRVAGLQVSACRRLVPVWSTPSVGRGGIRPRLQIEDCMRIVLADLSGADGFVSKDTVAGGYGSRFKPFSKTTAWVHKYKSQYHNTPSVHLAYLAAIFAGAGHQVVTTDHDVVDGDLAIVLSSLVDYRQETAWADQMRAKGVRVGFVGLAASKMPELFADHGDFILDGEPEAGAIRLAQGERLDGICKSEAIMDLDSLPFPRWDLVAKKRRGVRIALSPRPVGGGFPLLASRGCPEFCTYCPHRILAGYRPRSIGNVVEEIAQMCDQYRRPYVIFRDPLFSEDRDRVVEFCRALQARDLSINFECETRLDRLDFELLQTMSRAGLKAISFGVEAVSPQTLKKVGRRPIPPEHQRAVMQHCRDLGITTAAFFVLGFPSDTWESIAATIDFATELSPTFAQFKMLTPYPGTPLWKQMQPTIVENDWQKFDGFTPTFTHPHLSHRELMFLLGAAYTHFYMRPSYLANLLRLHNHRVREWVDRLDRRVSESISRNEGKLMRPVTC